MFYERNREKEQIQEKESDTEDIDELLMNQSSEGTHQLTNNNDQTQNTGKGYERYIEKENQNYFNRVNIKNYINPYLSKSNIGYNNENVNKESTYMASNKNEENYEQKTFDFKENTKRKNETDVNNYRTTEDNTKIYNYQQNSTANKYESKTKNTNPPSNNEKNKKNRRLNFSYDEDVNNFDNYNKLRNVKDKKDLVKFEYNNVTFNQKLDTENSSNSKNLKIGYKINNIKQDINKNTNANYYSQKNLNYVKNENKLENEDKLIVKKYQKKIETIDINSEKNMKGENELKIIKPQIMVKNYINNVQKSDNEETTFQQPNYYFSYDYSAKIKNYDNNSSEKSEMSTAINTAKYKNYQENQNKEVKVKEFNIMEETNENINENKYYKTQYITNNDKNDNYSLNQKEQNYINNLRILKSELNNEQSKSSSFIQMYEDKNKTDMNNITNNKLDLGKKLKYYNSTNNLIINEMKQKEKEKEKRNRKNKRKAK